MNDSLTAGKTWGRLKVGCSLEVQIVGRWLEAVGYKTLEVQLVGRRVHVEAVVCSLEVQLVGRWVD